MSKFSVDLRDVDHDAAEEQESAKKTKGRVTTEASQPQPTPDKGSSEVAPNLHSPSRVSVVVQESSPQAPIFVDPKTAAWDAEIARKFGDGTPQFQILNGMLQEDTVDFQAFKYRYVNEWGSIQQLISEMEKFIGRYAIDNVWISSFMLMEKATQGLENYTFEDLLEVITNRDQVLDTVKNPARMFKGPYGFVLAATAIQKIWRGHRAYTNFRQLKHLMKQATFIQRQYRLFQIRNNTKLKLRHLKEDQMAAWRAMQKEFRKMWPYLKHLQRTEIHINSFGLEEFQRKTIYKLKQKENSQLGRIFRVRDPNVRIILIVPFPLTPEIQDYYIKMLTLVDLPDARNRVRFVVPENYVKFSRHLSLTQQLLLSPMAMRKVKEMIMGEECYIVPGKMSKYDVQLSVQLSIPILGGDPGKTELYSTKSGAKDIFRKLAIPTPLGAHAIKDRYQFFKELTQLIADNLYT